MYSKESLGKISKKFQEWQNTTLANTLKENAERKKEFKTTSSRKIKILYTPLDLKNFSYENLGLPSEFPFTRGIQPTMYRGKLWTMRQYSGFGSAEDANKRFKYLISQGQTGLSVAFDLPTQIGYDADSKFAQGEVGKVGVAISSLNDMETLFNGINLEKVSTSMTINATAIVILAMYIAIAEKQNANIKNLNGTIQNDILKEYVARGTHIFPPKQSMRLVNDIFKFCSKEMPKWNTISISGYHIREAGSTAVQEIAFTFANAITYVQSAINSGLNVDDFARRLSFFFNAHNDLFEEVAKFRTARRLWAKIMKEKFNAKDKKSMQLRFHTQTAGCSLSAQQPENNIVRITIQALASVLGGTQSLHTNSMDEAFSLPGEKAVRIALRTQQIIAEESGVANTIDPFAGSYYLESLTNEMEEEVLKYLDKIEKMGGVLKAIENGYIQKEISESAYKYQKEIESNERVIVGVNKYKLIEEEKIEILKVSKKVEKLQKEKLKNLREKRDNFAVSKNLQKLKEIAESEENLFPIVLECVKNKATLQEICDVLREVFGEYKSVNWV